MLIRIQIPGYLPGVAVRYDIAMVKLAKRLFLVVLLTVALYAETVPIDIDDYQEGATAVRVEDSSLNVQWIDESGVAWQASFSRDASQPLITSVSGGDAVVLQSVRPFYRIETGIRRKGWNAFFDYPPMHEDGTQAFFGRLELDSIRVETVGNRVRVLCNGFRLGPFTGMLAYTFFPGSRLIQQEAIVSTDKPNLAYFYDAGIEFKAPGQEQIGRNMQTPFAYYDTQGKLQLQSANGMQPERVPYKLRYRVLASGTGEGSVAAFPAPHQYFFPRDFTSNLSQNWHRSWRGSVSLGIRQLSDTNWQFYPWMNAPEGSVQKMSMFMFLGTSEPQAVLEESLRFTNLDSYPELDGFQRLASHFHLAYTVQAVENGMNWVPPFKSVLQSMGVDAAIIMDFHGDGHPRDLTELRLQELDNFFEACKKQSDRNFLLIPSEEANVHLGGHWALTFPKPVYWWMNRPEGGKYMSSHPEYGTVYSTADETELLDLVRREDGWMYQTHARTKGSTGYPDAIRETEHFRDPRYFGAGWKAMPADLASPRLGERGFTLLDDMQNWGMNKQLIGEVDVFQFDHTHELYAHMNINYVKADKLPGFNQYGELMKPLREGQFFVSTGEIVMPSWKIYGGDDEITAEVDLRWTFPLKFAEVVWGDGEGTYRKIIDLQSSGAFKSEVFTWTLQAPGWKWARIAVWDVAANGAFINPVRR